MCKDKKKRVVLCSTTRPRDPMNINRTWPIWYIYLMEKMNFQTLKLAYSKSVIRDWLTIWQGIDPMNISKFRTWYLNQSTSFDNTNILINTSQCKNKKTILWKNNCTVLINGTNFSERGRGYIFCFFDLKKSR